MKLLNALSKGLDTTIFKISEMLDLGIILEENYTPYVDNFDINKKHKLTGIPNLETASGRYFKTEKDKRALSVWLFENDCVDYGLIEELKQYGVKLAKEIKTEIK